MKKLYSVLAIIVTLLAIGVASSASFICFYQPKVPKVLN